ncbi:hypothetical protein [Xanthomonas oryzae pv. oryzae MAFF 311018]|nr:hypothetical protein [Xanthomonas oryzae pv. oryzae MAFF 311018]
MQNPAATRPCSGRAVLKRESAVRMQWGAVSVPSVHDDEAVPRRPMDGLVEHKAASTRRAQIYGKCLIGLQNPCNAAWPGLVGCKCSAYAWQPGAGSGT